MGGGPASELRAHSRRLPRRSDAVDAASQAAPWRPDGPPTRLLRRSSKLAMGNCML